MQNPPLTIRLARPQDAENWLSLYYLQSNQPQPVDLTEQVKQFQLASSDVAMSRFIVLLGDEPIAYFTLHPLENVATLRDFFVVNTYLAEYGSKILQHIVALVQNHDYSILIVEWYPEIYSKMFASAGFQQNTRTKMIASLNDYQIQPVNIPPGIRMRHPELHDEHTLAELAYRNYQGAIDEEMVSSSKALAIAMMHDIFAEVYCRLDRDSSFLAEDEQQRLIGSVLLGTIHTGAEGVIRILDISTAPDWRGKGVGKTLFVNGLDAAKAKGYVQADLLVTLGNDRAIALYRSCGFKEVGSLMHEAVLKLKA
jgi:ribosomal protein S18 acetylase RimI-like enzyme